MSVDEYKIMDFVTNEAYFDDDVESVVSLNDNNTQKLMGTPRIKRATQETNQGCSVYLRIRPLHVSKNVENKADASPTIVYNSNTQADAYCTHKDGEFHGSYQFSRVFSPESRQEEVFDVTTQPLIEDLFHGKNSLIFAYGITCSGKTFTMQGTKSEQGIIPRTLHAIFDRLNSTQTGFEVETSFLEIYNDNAFDLLNPNTNAKLTILVADNVPVTVKGLTERTVRNVTEALKIMDSGISNRQVNSTSLNKESSRSHSVFTISLKSRGEVFAKMSIIDLAGAERSSRTGSTNRKQQDETKNINKSLSALRMCIDALSNNASHVPYRDSTLTKLFKDVFVGHGSLSMICNVNPSPSEFDETIHSVTYATQAKNLNIKSKVNNNRGKMNNFRNQGTLSSGDMEALAAFRTMSFEFKEKETAYMNMLMEASQNSAETVYSAMKRLNSMLLSQRDAMDKASELQDARHKLEMSKLSGDTPSQLELRMEQFVNAQYEATIAELNDVIVKHSNTIDSLADRVFTLEEDLAKSREANSDLNRLRHQEAADTSALLEKIVAKVKAGMSVAENQVHERYSVVLKASEEEAERLKDEIVKLKAENTKIVMENTKLKDQRDQREVASVRNNTNPNDVFQQAFQVTSSNASSHSLAPPSTSTKRKSDVGLESKKTVKRTRKIEGKPEEDDTENDPPAASRTARSTRVTRIKTTKKDEPTAPTRMTRSQAAAARSGKII